MLAHTVDDRPSEFPKLITTESRTQGDGGQVTLYIVRYLHSTELRTACMHMRSGCTMHIPRHFEVDVELLSGEDECVLVRHGDEAEEPRRFRRTPLAAGAVCMRDVLSA